MQSRLWASLFVVSVLVVSVPAQRRQRAPSPIPQQRSDLTIHVVLPDDRPADMQLQVQLLNMGGAPIAQQYTTAAGEARFAGIAPGNYQVRVSGIGVEETTSNIELSGFEHSHMEYVPVKPSSAPKQAVSPEGTISAKALQIPEKARKELEKGNAEAHRQQWAAAVKHYHEAVDAYPNYAAAYNNLGVACEQLKNYACARDAWEKASQIDPGSARALVNLARLRETEHNYSDAEVLLQRAVSIEPLNPQSLVLLANAELMLGKFDQAVLYAQKVHTLPHQGYAAAHVIAGEALEAQQKYDQAAAEYQMLLQEAPYDPAAADAQKGLARLHQPAIAKQP